MGMHWLVLGLPRTLDAENPTVQPEQNRSRGQLVAPGLVAPHPDIAVDLPVTAPFGIFRTTMLGLHEPAGD